MALWPGLEQRGQVEMTLLSTEAATATPLFIDYLPLVRSIHRSSPAVVTSLLSHASAGFIQAISEVFHNIVKGSMTLTNRQTAYLRRHKDIVKKIGTRSASIKLRRQLLIDNIPLLKRIVGIVRELF